jgi:hypothetical protein
MATIVFTVDPQNQEKLLETLIDATETTMKRMRGFISARSIRASMGRRSSTIGGQPSRLNSLKVEYRRYSIGLAVIDRENSHSAHYNQGEWENPERGRDTPTIPERQRLLIPLPLHRRGIHKAAGRDNHRRRSRGA